MQRVLLIVCLILSFTLLFFGFFHPVTAINEDLGRHLLLGEIITNTHTVPATNLLSYTFPNHPFINSHWLSEVIFYFLLKLGGYNLLLITTTLISLISFSLLFLLALKKFSLATCVIATALFMPIFVSRTDIRPEIFSFLFVSIFLFILYTNRTHGTKWLYLLIPLEILWVNIHIYFFVGPVLILFFLLDHLATHKRKLTNDSKKLALVFLLTTLGSLINPNGIHGAFLPFTVLQNYGIPIIENQNVFIINNTFPQTQITYILFVMLLVFILLSLARKKIKLLDWLLTIFFSCFALYAIRNFPLFAYAAFIPFATALDHTLPNLKQRMELYLTKKQQTFLIHFSLTMTIVLLIVFVTSVASKQGVGFGISEKGEGAADFFITHQLTGPIYNNFDIGSYLASRLYPKERVFVDGRPEAYPKDFFQQTYFPMQTNPEKFDAVQKKYHFNTLILSLQNQTNEPNTLLSILTKRHDFKKVYADHELAIFERIISVR